MTKTNRNFCLFIYSLRINRWVVLAVFLLLFVFAIDIASFSIILNRFRFIVQCDEYFSFNVYAMYAVTIQRVFYPVRCACKTLFCFFFSSSSVDFFVDWIFFFCGILLWYFFHILVTKQEVSKWIYVVFILEHKFCSFFSCTKLRHTDKCLLVRRNIVIGGKCSVNYYLHSYSVTFTGFCFRSFVRS